MRSTINDIVRATGYAKSTVSAALNNKPGVGVEAKELILQTAREINYVPNQIARSLSSKCNKTIGVIVRDITNPFYARVCRSIEQVAEENGYFIITYNTDGRAERLINAANVFVGQSVSGMIVDVSESEGGSVSAFFDYLKRREVPYVLFGTKSAFSEIDSVEADDIQGAYQAARYLIEQGHRDICYIGGGEDVVYSKHRLMGIRQAFDACGLAWAADMWKLTARTVQEGYEAGKRILSGARRPTAVIAYNDLVAVGVIKAYTEQGLQIPADLSIIGFDNIETVAFPLTSVDIPEYEMGKTATELLIRRIQNPEDTQVQSVQFEEKLIVRGSVRKL